MRGLWLRVTAFTGSEKAKSAGLGRGKERVSSCPSGCLALRAPGAIRISNTCFTITMKRRSILRLWWVAKWNSNSLRPS
jgi:hypothetical protein